MTLSTSEVKSLAKKYLMGNVARYDLSLVKGKGLKVWDAEGNEYNDFISGIATCALGHSPDILAEALAEQAKELVHVSNLFYNEPLVLLAQLLTAASGLDVAFFCNSGTEANEAAIKLARKYSFLKYGPGRHGIITALDSFHGRTLGSVSATGQDKVKDGFHPLVPGFTHVPYGDSRAMLKAVNTETCAIMLEPVQGEGGAVVPPENYFRDVETICEKFDLLLIVDEVQTGLGRTGRDFAFKHFGVKPHIMTLAKALGCGVPAGAMLAQREVAEAFSPGSHSTTGGGSPLVMAAALKVCREILKPEFLAEAANVGEYFKTRLNEVKDQLGPEIVTEVRGIGLILGMVLNFPAGPVVTDMMKRGFIINATAGKVLRFVPPLNVTRSEIDNLIPALIESVRKVHQETVDNK